MTPVSHRVRVAALLTLVCLALLALASCGGAPPVYVHRYLLGYPPPEPAAPPPLDAAIKVERFGSLPLVNTQNMLILGAKQETSHYQYHRWQNYPADMVSSLLTRDLQASRRYLAVFGPDSSQLPRFRLEGGVERFVQETQAGGVQAQLRLEVTLLDYRQREVVKQVMYQKSYAQSVPMSASDAAALAQALSQAMARISPQVLADLEKAIAARLAQDPPPGPAKDK